MSESSILSSFGANVVNCRRGFFDCWDWKYLNRSGPFCLINGPFWPPLTAQGLGSYLFVIITHGSRRSRATEAVHITNGVWSSRRQYLLNSRRDEHKNRQQKHDLSHQSNHPAASNSPGYQVPQIPGSSALIIDQKGSSWVPLSLISI